MTGRGHGQLTPLGARGAEHDAEGGGAEAAGAHPRHGGGDVPPAAARRLLRGPSCRQALLEAISAAESLQECSPWPLRK